MKAWIGVDPGSHGCIALISETGEVEILRLEKHTEKEIFEWLSDVTFRYSIMMCVKEKVWAMPARNPDGSARTMGAQTMFTFGEGNGMIRAFLVATSIPFTENVPQTWQKIYGLKKDKGESQPDFKKRLREKAEQLFPKVKMTNDVSDALLIAEFARRTFNQ